MNSFCITGLQKSFSIFLRQSNVKRTLELQPVLQTVIPARSTFVLKRKYPVKLAKKGAETRKLKAKDYLYELAEHKDTQKKPEISVILKEYVDGLGNKGDCVKVRRLFAYNQLLITGLADYATPEAIEKAKLNKNEGEKEQYSSNYAPLTVKFLENMSLSVQMNKDVEWTLEPWHVRVAFRKAGVFVPTECIQLPTKPIKGPNIDLDGKAFCVTVTINNREKATVRCLLHYWIPNISERVPFVTPPWTLPYSCIFPEDEEEIKNLPPIKFKSLKA